MSIPVSRKPLLAAGAIATLLAVAAVTLSLLFSMAIRAERDLGVFPFKEEDWYRFLLPSQFAPRDRPVVMLAGPSQVRENLRIEELRAAFPDHHVYQGALSLGTVEDVEIALRFVETAYGKEALPDFLVIGTSARFIANLPLDRPFASVINSYSPWIVAAGPAGVEIAPKPFPAAVVARLKFLGKQPARFEAALRGWLHRFAQDFADWGPGAEILGATGLGGFWERRLTALELPTTPYKFARSARRPDAAIAGDFVDRGSFWVEVIRWDAKSQRAAAAKRLGRLMAFLDDRGIGVAVINMPERSLARNTFAFDYDDYLGAVREAIGGSPFIDLRAFARDDEFHDAEHTLPEGSRRLTEKVIAWLGPLLGG